MSLEIPAKTLPSNFQQEYLDAQLQLDFQPKQSIEFFDMLQKNNISPSTLVMDEYKNTSIKISKYKLDDLRVTSKLHLSNDCLQYSEKYSKDVNPDVKLTKLRKTNMHNNKSKIPGLWIRLPYRNQKQKSEPYTLSYHSHWLIQEAEQRRLDQERGTLNINRKPLPDSVIQKITQRVQSMGIGERKR